MKRLRMVLCLASIALFAFAATATAQTCQDIHGVGSNGCAPSPMDGAAASVTGVVYSVAGTFNSGSTYIQCSGGTGGMTFFASGNTLAVGDEITLSGTVGAFGDEIQINSPTWVVNSTGNAVSPTPITTGDLFAGTDRLGDFMSVTGVMTIVSAGFNSVYSIDDGSGPCLLFVDGTTGIDTAFIDSQYLGNIVTVVGATKCFGGEGEILPRSDADFDLQTVAIDDASFGEVKADFQK